MGVTSWDEYLFKQLRIVAVDPWCRASLSLLDVFTKRGRYGIINHGPILAHRGALTGLAMETPDEPATTQAQTNLEEARMGRGLHVQSGIAQVPVVATLKSSSKILASLSKVVSAECTKSKSLIAEVSLVTSVSIDKDFIGEQVKEGKWKPDPNSPLMPSSWDRVLWVVVEIYYAKKLVIGKSRKAVAKANVDPSKLVALPELPGNLLGKVEVSKDKDETTLLEIPENGPAFPIGFKAIRLVYDKNGDLLAPGGIRLDSPAHRPKTRSAVEWLDPDKDEDSAVYHMKDLFTQESAAGPMLALPMFDAEGQATDAADASTAEE